LKRLVSSLAGLAIVIALLGPQTAFARMHFTTTNERLDALSQASNSSLNLTDAAAIQTQINEITTQAQAAKAAAEDAATRPASNAQDKSVLATVSQEMDAIVTAANKAKSETGAAQKSDLQDIQKRVDQQSQAVKTRIQEQLAAPLPAASPQVLPSAGDALTSGGISTLAGIVGALFVVGGAGVFGLTRWRRSV
jgi:cobalamin biosynthesis Mg chelatase CobN